MKFFGYSCSSEASTPSPVELANLQAVIRFIKDHYEAYQLIITDAGDKQLLVMREGVDLYNALDQYDISLAAIIDELRQDFTAEKSTQKENPEWEVLFDRIGLSPGEIRMRQRVKNLCKTAQTVADVADLIRGTYFDAHFVSDDGCKWCRFFKQDDYSAALMIKDESGKWVDDPAPIYLSPVAKVKHLRSSEDIHTFLLLDF